MIELKDPKFKEIKSRFDKQIFDFVTENAVSITKQAYADLEAEVPQVPIFDDYLSRLEKEIEDSVAKAGFFNGTARRLVQRYREVFYHSSLPILMEKYHKEDH